MSNFISFVTKYTANTKKMQYLISDIKEDKILHLLLDNAEIKKHINNKIFKADYELENEWKKLWNDFQSRL